MQVQQYASSSTFSLLGSSQRALECPVDTLTPNFPLPQATPSLSDLLSHSGTAASLLKKRKAEVIVGLLDAALSGDMSTFSSSYHYSLDGDVTELLGSALGLTDGTVDA